MKVRRTLFAFAFALPLLPVSGVSQRTPTTPLAASAPTAIPALVPYSGAALDSKGNPLAGETGATFLIFKDEQGGEPLWAESQTVAFDSAGHYKVQLGAASPSGLPSALFATGEARWLEVQIAGQQPEPRVLLASVPYALKAADAATLGGLPASAFALAGSKAATNINSTNSTAITPDASASNVTTTGGTSGYLPVFTGKSTVADSILYSSATGIGVGDVPNSSAVFDVNGKSIWRGLLNVSRAGTATASTGYPSFPMLFQAAAYNSSSKAALFPVFQLQAEPTGNNTATTGATFNLLYGPNDGTPAETGLYFNSNGTIHFATGQTFPGTGTGNGTISGVTAGTDLTGGGTSGNVTLKLDTTKVPALAANNTYTGSNVFVPSLYEDTDVNIDNKNANTGNISPGLRLGQASGEGMASKRTAGGNQYGVDIYTGYSPRLQINASGQVAIGTGGVFNAAQLQAQSASSIGIFGETSSVTSTDAAVYGVADGAANGVTGQSSGGNGAEFFGGTSSGGAGLFGSYSLGGLGYGSGQAGGNGVVGYGGSSDSGDGGDGGYFHGGYASTGLGGYGGYFIGGDSGSEYEGGYGIFVTGGNGLNNTGPQEAYSALFQQDIHVNGSVVTNAQKIQIDDPADPANKYLVHTAVASSEQMNIYSGNVTTDELGVATVTLPTWFQTLNTDFRYQLTVVGGRFAQAIVSKEIAGNQFTISTNATGVKVSWQVTAVRQDAYAKAHPLVVEQAKGSRERGFYQHPELYGQPEEKQIEWGTHPETMRRLQAARNARNTALGSSQTPAAKPPTASASH